MKRTKVIDVEVSWGGFGGIGIGSYAEKEWVVERISFVGADGDTITIVCECVHEDDHE